LDQGNTVPFIARYRKELTEWATDEQLRDFADIYDYTKNLQARKADVIRLIGEKWLMTPELEKQIMDAQTLAKVEDLYRPYKEKKLSKASIAKGKWLEPLAQLLKACQLTLAQFSAEAVKFIIDTGDAKTSVKSPDEAIQWAQDVIAEEVADHAALRDVIRHSTSNSIMLVAKPTKIFEENGTYKIYANYSKRLSEIPSYAFLAVTRAEDEKQLSVSLGRNLETLKQSADQFFIPKSNSESPRGGKYSDLKATLDQAIEDGIKRLLVPSLDREFMSDKKRRSDEAAIKLFGENLKQLLLTPPVRGKIALGMDPGYRTGTKLAVVDATGKFLAKDVIFATMPHDNLDKADSIVSSLITKYGIELIVIGNGTASREASTFTANLIKKHKLDTKYMVVSEAGASVYSASKLAQDEYPDLDVTVRWAISIAHRVQDPLAELTKIDPKAIWVWQYQHDVDQKLLAQKLDERVQDVVNGVWVDVNTASATLLQYIAWLTPKIASNIVSYRDANGPFTSKAQLKKVAGLWPKAYEQCVWFLRIIDGKEPLDATGIHPEMYDKVYTMIESEVWISKKKVVLPIDLLGSTPLWKGGAEGGGIWKLASKYDIGAQTLSDILTELARPGRDPRDDLDPPAFASDILDIKDLTIGMTLQWIVRNITDFGAFVDIGLHSDGLVHKSQMADRYVAHPMDVVSLGQQVSVRVVDIDLDREKVALSMKSQSNPPLWKGGAEGGGISRQPQTQSVPRPAPVQPTPPVESVSEIKSNIKRG
jgi:protein Tex